MKNTIGVFTLFCVLAFAAYGQTAHNAGETRHVTLTRQGDALTVFDRVNMRDAPSLSGTVVRQAFFGDFFTVYDTSGSRVMENGVLDLWHRVSPDSELWINALFVRLLPFRIATRETVPYCGRTLNNRMYITIIGYREAPDGHAEVRIRRGAWGGTFLPLVYPPDAVFSNPYLTFARNYQFGNDHETFAMSLYNSAFQNLHDYSTEIWNFSREADQFGEGAITVRERSREYHLTEIHSQTVPLTGVRIGSSFDDVRRQFGVEFLRWENLPVPNWHGIAVYEGSLSLFPVRLEFWIQEDNTVQRIVRLQSLAR